MSKLMLVILAVALAAPLAGLALAEAVAAPSRARQATATDIDRALHAALPPGQADAAGLRAVTLRE